MEDKLLDGREARRHLVVVDVTIAPEAEIVKTKRSHPGIQCNSGVPVIVVDLNRVGVAGYTFGGFMEALRMGILAHYFPPVTQAVPPGCWEEFRHNLLMELDTGIEYAFHNLSNLGSHPVSQYPHIEATRGQLFAARQMVRQLI